jgi:hypothetical protein
MAAAVLKEALNEAGVRGQGLSAPLAFALHRFARHPSAKHASALHPLAPHPSAPFRLAQHPSAPFRLALHPFALRKPARAAGRPTACARFLSAKRRTRRSIRFCGAEPERVDRADRADRVERSSLGSSL